MADNNLGSEGSSEATDVTKDINLLAEGEDESTTEPSQEVEDSTTEEEEGEENEEQAESEEEQETEEEESVEEDEEEAKITRPSWKEIKEKYPELAKNKEFREVYFRDRAFTELFPTVEDAKIASEQSAAFEFFNSSLGSDGNPTVLVNALANDPKLLLNFSEKILPTLYNIDQKAFVSATAPMLSAMFNDIHDKAAQAGNENLKTSILNVINYLYGGKYGTLPPRVNRKPNPEAEEEKNRYIQARRELLVGQHHEFLSKAERSIGKQLEKVVTEGLEDIENEWTRRSIVKETLAEVKSQLNQDEGFQNRLKQLHNSALKAGFTPEFVSRLVSAYIGRAKSVALQIRAKYRSEALGKRSSKSAPQDKKRVEGTGKGNSDSRNSGNSKEDLRNTRKFSDFDILNK